MVNVAINGLGRVGRLLVRQMSTRPIDDLRIVAANDLVDQETLRYLLRYDSVHGPLNEPVAIDNSCLSVGDQSIRLFSEEDPRALPWKELEVDVVLECTGRFRKAEDAARHIQAGAAKVIISAPSESADLSLVLGVNNDAYDAASHHIISTTSCTTNSLVPPLKVLLDNFGIESVLATTIHAYTISQGTVDQAAKIRIRGRAAAINIIPCSTGADIATTLVLPQLSGKISVLAVRVPVPDGALTDISAVVKQDVSVEQVNAAFREAAEVSLNGILQYSEDELVSSDILGNTHSGIVHALSTRVVGGRAVKLQVWYDNECAYARRLLEAALFVSEGLSSNR